MAAPRISRRAYERYLCKLEVRIHFPGSRGAISGEIINISLGGAYLRTQSSLPSTTLILEIPNEGKTLRLEAQVMHADNRPKEKNSFGYGIAFSVVSRLEPKLKRFIDGIRREQWASKTGTKSGELKRDYWSL